MARRSKLVEIRGDKARLIRLLNYAGGVHTIDSTPLVELDGEWHGVCMGKCDAAFSLPSARCLDSTVRWVNAIIHVKSEFVVTQAAANQECAPQQAEMRVWDRSRDRIYGRSDSGDQLCITIVLRRMRPLNAVAIHFCLSTQRVRGRQIWWRGKSGARAE